MPPSSSHSQLLLPTSAHCFFWAFWLALTWISYPALFSSAPSSPFTIVFSVDVSAEGTTWRSQGWKRCWECFYSTLRSLALHTSLCISEMLQEHTGASLPFPRHLKAGLQVPQEKDAKDMGLNVGCSGWVQLEIRCPSFHCAADARVTAPSHGTQLRQWNFTNSERQVEHRAKDQPLSPPTMSFHPVPYLFPSPSSCPCFKVTGLLCLHPLFSPGRADPREEVDALAHKTGSDPASLPS